MWSQVVGFEVVGYNDSLAASFKVVGYSTNHQFEITRMFEAFKLASMWCHKCNVLCHDTIVFTPQSQMGSL
jgi:hypothetical protein